MVLNSQPFAAPVSGSSRLSTVSKWWTLQKVFVVRHSRGFSLYTDAPAGMLFMVVQASDRLQSSSKAALRTSSGNQPTTRSQDAATSRQEPEVGSVMGESSAFTTAASFVDPAGEDTHTHTSVKQEDEASAAGRLSWSHLRDISPHVAFKAHQLVTQPSAFSDATVAVRFETANFPLQPP